MELERVLVDDNYDAEPYFRLLCTELEGCGIAVEKLNVETKYKDKCILICSHQTSAEFALMNGLSFVTYNYFHKGSQCIIEGFDEITADFLNKMYERFKGIPWEIAETEHLLIREFSVEDKTDIFPDISTDPDFTQKYIEKMYGICGFGIWAVFLKSSRKFIGRAGVFNSSDTQGLELGYSIEPEYRNQGYAYEACRAIIGYAEKILGLDFLSAFIDRNNSASIALAKKLGFQESDRINNAGQICYELNIRQV